MRDVWKPVPSMPGWLACNDGRVLMPPRVGPMPHGGFRTYLTEPTFGCEKRSKTDAKHVYMGIWTRHDGNRKVHQLVCEAFHGPKPFPTAVVIHRDENALNNRASNLKWGTQKENLNALGFRQQLSDRARGKVRLRNTRTMTDAAMGEG